MPELKWLVACLSALNQRHPIFTKDYTPEKSKDPYLEEKLDQIKGSHFLKLVMFEGLPPSLLVRKKALKNFSALQQRIPEHPSSARPGGQQRQWVVPNSRQFFKVQKKHKQRKPNEPDWDQLFEPSFMSR